MTISLRLLLEPEIRKAAELCAQATKLIEESKEDAPLGREATKALFAAFDACCVALHGAQDERALLLLSSADIEAHL